jgi:hypothetical protein
MALSGKNLTAEYAEKYAETIEASKSLTYKTTTQHFN